MKSRVRGLPPGPHRRREASRQFRNGKSLASPGMPHCPQGPRPQLRSTRTRPVDITNCRVPLPNPVISFRHSHSFTVPESPPCLSANHPDQMTSVSKRHFGAGRLACANSRPRSNSQSVPLWQNRRNHDAANRFGRTDLPPRRLSRRAQRAHRSQRSAHIIAQVCASASIHVTESLSALIGSHLHRRPLIPEVAGVSTMLAERDLRSAYPPLRTAHTASALRGTPSQCRQCRALRRNDEPGQCSDD